MGAQEFYFGNDLSYVNQMEDCGADFKEWGQSKDIYQIFADHGNNLVRLRLWVDPSWQNSIEQPAGVKNQYSDLEDVKEAIQRSQDAGMKVLLDFHYSDFWADPGRQVVPARWQGVATNTQALSDSVYNYTFSVLDELNTEGLLPELVQVGNETNGGMLLYESMDEDFDGVNYIDGGWSRQAQLFNAGISAVRDAADSASSEIKIALHYAGVGRGLTDWYRNVVGNGITDFDIIGFSYYYSWHGSSITSVANQVSELAEEFPDKEIVILETGYPWTDENFDGSGNIITETTAPYEPLSPEIQLAYLVDLSKAMMEAGGDGVVFWESAWVSTNCRTPWAQGSSHDHVVFFEPGTNNFIQTGGGRWMEAENYADMESIQTIFRVDMSSDPRAAYITGDFTNGIKTMYPEGDNQYAFVKYLSPNATGNYSFAWQTFPGAEENVPEACSDGGMRSYTITDSTNVYDFLWESCERISEQYTGPTDTLTLTFIVDMEGVNAPNGAFVTGDFTSDGNWSIEPMDHLGGTFYIYETSTDANVEGGWYFLDGNDWNDRETVPSECVGYYNQDRGFFVENEDVTYAFKFGSCEVADSSAVSNELDEEVPERGSLYQNYPNPFNPTTAIYYELAEASRVDLSVYNLLGQKVQTLISDRKSAGLHQVMFNAQDLPSGMYVYQLIADDFIQSKTMMLLK